MEKYNLKVYYYVTGTQYRIYSRPISKMSESEKLMKKELESRIENKLRKENPKKADRMEKLAEAREELKKKKGTFNPFTNTVEYIVDMEQAERNKQVSLNRSKQSLIGICRANRWDYFITFTFNQKLVDSSNYEEVCHKAGKWLNNIRSRLCPDLKYVLVPELHKDREHYHLHGLLANCSGLQLRVSGKFDKKGNVIYNIPSWKYGFNTVTEVGHTGKVSNYIAKYITKDTEGLLHGRHRYWCSRNTVRAKDVCDEVYIENHMKILENLSGHMDFIKKTYVPQCNRDIYYIETGENNEPIDSKSTRKSKETRDIRGYSVAAEPPVRCGGSHLS
ncbi:MAG: DUF1090 domain-containing protein, partial [Clostridiales bacterium]|nr:DUF1090 domain-containing protein [Clostridiales bacterium]